MSLLLTDRMLLAKRLRASVVEPATTAINMDTDVGNVAVGGVGADCELVHTTRDMITLRTKQSGTACCHFRNYVYLGIPTSTGRHSTYQKGNTGEYSRCTALQLYRQLC